MYEMMAGNPPFRAKSLKDLNHKILHDKITMPKWLTSEVCYRSCYYCYYYYYYYMTNSRVLVT